MQSEVTEIKRQADLADISQTELAFHSKLARPKVCRIFRGYELATDEELEAMTNGLRAAALDRAKRLRAIVSNSHTSPAKGEPAKAVDTHSNGDGTYYTITHHADGSAVRDEHNSYSAAKEHGARMFLEGPAMEAPSTNKTIIEVGA